MENDLEFLSSLRTPGEEELKRLWELLSSQDRDVKHEAWRAVERLMELRGLPTSWFLEALCHPDHGSRYRAWNSVPRFLDGLGRESVRERVRCFLQLLVTDNQTVRALSWYATLIPLLRAKVLSFAEVSPLMKWCLEVGGEWRELILETCEELESMRTQG